MKKRIVWLTAVAMAFGLYTSAKTVITAPTGLPDESDVVLESAVNAVKAVPADTVKAIGGAIYFAGDELRNTAHGVKATFEGATPPETARQEMFGEVAGAWGAPDEIVLRSYKITPAVVKEMAPGEYAPGAVIDVKSFFSGVDFSADTGAYLWPDSNRLMVRNTRQKLLQIETALSQYHRAENDYRQVEIKAKFIEVSQSTLNQLGFNWRIEDAGPNGVNLLDHWSLNSNQNKNNPQNGTAFENGLRTAAGAFGAGTPVAGSMVLTKSGWMPIKLAINALEQSGDSDVLSSPSLTTLNGKSAEIWVGEDRMVPKSFDVKAEEINIHIEHTHWSSELIGVYLNVIPEIEKDDMIRLKLNPKIVDLLGYDTYKVSPVASMLAINGGTLIQSTVEGRFPITKWTENGLSAVWQQMSDSLSSVYGPNADPNDPKNWGSTAATANTGYANIFRKTDHETFGTPLKAVNGQLPYFRIREIKTQAVVADGNTVGLGGLIYDRLETYKDKVPVLGSIPLFGRLFRSEGERSIKRNLMIFVSASQVDNNGQRKSDVALNK